MTLGAFSLHDRHIVVLGASSGIGRQIALRCAEAGARVSVAARREEQLESLVMELPQDEHGFQTLDISKPDTATDALDRFVEERGRIDGLVYAIGYNAIRPLNVIDAPYWSAMMAANLNGAALACQLASDARRMAAGGLAAVLVSSAGAARPGGAGMAAYCAAKSGLEGLTKALAVEGARRNVRVNAIRPGAVRTELWNQPSWTEQQKQAVESKHPLGVGQTDDVAYAAVYLLSPAARWVTGSILTVDGGYSIS